MPGEYYSGIPGSRSKQEIRRRTDLICLAKALILLDQTPRLLVTFDQGCSRHIIEAELQRRQDHKLSPGHHSVLGAQLQLNPEAAPNTQVVKQGIARCC